MAKPYISQDIKKRILREDTKYYSQFDCRVCLRNTAALPIYGDEHKPDISLEIITFGDIHLDQNDEYPKFICSYCFSLLEGAVLFRKSAQRSQSLLKRRKPEETVNEPPDTKDFNTNLDFSEEYLDDDSYGDITDLDKPKIDFVSVKSDDNAKENASGNKEEFSETDTNNECTENKIIMFVESDVKKKTQYSYEYIVCTYCNIRFETSNAYEEHRETIEHKRNYVISFLPKKRRDMNPNSPNKPRRAIAPGDRITVNPKDQKCEICDRYFTKLHYPRHMRTQHEINIETSRTATKKECPICFKKLNAMTIPRHMKKIHGDEKDLPPKIKIECPVCKKLFSKDFFPLHIQRHKQGDNKNYICDQCGKKFFFKSSFCTHRLIHTNDLPHKCEYCPYRGRTKELLKIHVRTHTGDYPYKCTQCSTRCLTKSNLNSHMRRHRGPIDFICDVCNRGFYSKIQLERHIAVSHYGIKNHVCSICGAAFGYRHGLMSHQRKVHKRPKGIGKPKAVYLQLEEEGLLQPQEEV